MSEAQSMPGQTAAGRPAFLGATVAEDSLPSAQAALEMNRQLRSIEPLRKAAFTRHLKPLGVTWGSHLILLQLLNTPDYKLGQAEIVRRLGVTAGNINRMIHHLEAIGLVSQIDNPNDRRMVDVQLTARGVEIGELVMPEVRRFHRLVSGCFSESELMVLNQYLQRLREHLVSSDPDA